MKQILQHLRTGATEIAEVPCPAPGAGQVLIRSSCSLISAGTERMLLDFSKANAIQKARQQPEKVRMVLEKLKTDGLAPTIASIRQKLDQPLPLGYCNVGRVLATGRLVRGFAEGDRVASNGAHAEVVSVPMHLSARVPDQVSDEAAAFTVIGAIALQGLRLAQPTLGEAVVVTGLGLIGQIAVQLLRATGCRVLGIDPDPARLALARSFGAETVDLSAGEDPVACAVRFSRGRGVDAVVVTAATKSSEPIHQAALMCRTRGRIVLVGVTGLELDRADFYKKELSFQVSCSYGPGRYDPEYEDAGHDYPVGFVRWTEQRNFEAVLDMLADGRLQVEPLVSHRFAFADAEAAYAVIAGRQPSLGILLAYPGRQVQSDEALRASRVALPTPPGGRPAPAPTPAVAVIGAGQYAGAVLMPAFKAAGARLVTAASSGGIAGVVAGRRHGFEEATTDSSRILADPAVDTVVIATRHDSHARWVVDALDAGKHVFVEKPLCLTHDELAAIEAACGRTPGRLLMVGFNRRFAPHVQTMKRLLDGVKGPKSFIVTINAGAIPGDHWTQDPIRGGGRVAGEACHFIDLLRHLAGAAIASHGRQTMAAAHGDTVSLQLQFDDGSIGTIHYFANGSRAFPKERLEVFAQGRVLQLDNFRTLRGFGWPSFGTERSWRQDKGQRACVAAFVEALRTGAASPIPYDEIIEVSRVTIDLAALS